jgi:hypothetical protein
VSRVRAVAERYAADLAAAAADDDVDLGVGVSNTKSCPRLLLEARDGGVVGRERAGRGLGD